MGVGQIIKDFGKNLWSEFTAVLSAIGGFLSSFFDVWSVSVDDFEAIVEDYNEVKQNLKDEVQKIKDFSLQPHLKTRVINVPSAISQAHSLIDDMRQSLTDVTDGIVQPIHDLILVWKTESAQLSNSMDKPSGLARASSFLGSVQTSVKQIRTAMDSAKDLTDLANQITDSLDSLDSVFLQQKNPRKRVKHSAKIRVGFLHQ
jgi:hypothetical protein